MRLMHNLAEVTASEEALNAAAKEFAKFCEEDWKRRDELLDRTDNKIQTPDDFIAMCDRHGHDVYKNCKKFRGINVND